VTSADLRRALEETSGLDLSRFFAQWVYGAGVPAFRVSWAFDSVRSEVALTAVQVQPRDSLTGLFHADVDVEVLTDSGLVRQVAAVRGETTAVVIPVPAAPRSIRWDAGDWLLDLADFPRPTAMLAWQLAHDSDVLGRVEAIEALASRVESEPEARDAVARAARDSLWMVRTRAVTALAPVVTHDSVRPIVMNATRDSDTRVREAAALALARAAGSREAVSRLRALAQNDRSWWVRAAAMRAMGIARDMLRREEWRDVARVAALEGLARIKSPDSRDLIVEQLAAGARPGRVAAINALVAHATRGDTASARVLEPLLENEDPFIRSAAAGALGRIGDARSRAALQARREVEQEARVQAALDQAIRRLGS
jgi:aminopeptidase N